METPRDCCTSTYNVLSNSGRGPLGIVVKSCKTTGRNTGIPAILYATQVFLLFLPFTETGFSGSPKTLRNPNPVLIGCRACPAAMVGAAPAESAGPEATVEPPFPLSYCTVHSSKGSCYTVTCSICGWGGKDGKTATLHKLIYGHFLSLPKQDIASCVPPDRIKANHPELWAPLQERHER